MRVEVVEERLEEELGHAAIVRRRFPSPSSSRPISSRR